MKHGTPLVIVVVAVALAGCGHAAQGTPEHAASPTALASATATSQATPLAEATPGWHMYTNTAGAYSLKYPASWYEIPNPNFPNDYPSSFSNENAGYWPRSTPQIGTADNVFLTVGRDPTPGGCGAYSDPVRASDTTLGDDPAKRYVTASPPGFGNPDPSYRILIEGVHQNHCWLLSFDSRTQRARDTNAADDDQIVASFKFLD